MDFDDFVTSMIGFLIILMAAGLCILILFGGIDLVQSYRSRYKQLACRDMGREPVRATLSDSVVCAVRVGGMDSLNVKLESRP